MDIAEKLEILADAAKYDVACTSSGVDRNAKRGELGHASAAGCCHSFTPDGRCICLLKVLLTNCCIYDCAYCVNRCSNDTKRAAFKPRELAELTIAFYRRNYIEGLFLSSGVLQSPDYTMELIAETLRILREEYGFRGYIHAKAIPGCSPELLDKVSLLADRVSVNMELPSQESLNRLCPEKSGNSVLSPMKQLRENIADDRETRALMRRKTHYLSKQRVTKKQRAYAPAGQSTQMIIGASPESDHHILKLSSALYKNVQMKRVFFSAYIPVVQDSRLPNSAAIPLDREHRLFQADWLMRFYGFDVDEIIDEDHPFLDLSVDPKANWALNNLDFFPVEVTKASYEALLRVPGIGVRGAQKIIQARKTSPLGESELKKLGVAIKRARYFITCNGKWFGQGIAFERDALRAHLAAPINGGNKGRRSSKSIPGQLSFEELDESFCVGAAGRKQLTPGAHNTSREQLTSSPSVAACTQLNSNSHATAYPQLTSSSCTSVRSVLPPDVEAALKASEMWSSNATGHDSTPNILAAAASTMGTSMPKVPNAAFQASPLPQGLIASSVLAGPSTNYAGSALRIANVVGAAPANSLEGFWYQ